MAMLKTCACLPACLYIDDYQNMNNSVPTKCNCQLEAEPTKETNAAKAAKAAKAAACSTLSQNSDCETAACWRRQVALLATSAPLHSLGCKKGMSVGRSVGRWIDLLLSCIYMCLHLHVPVGLSVPCLVVHFARSLACLLAIKYCRIVLFSKSSDTFVACSLLFCISVWCSIDLQLQYCLVVSIS